MRAPQLLFLAFILAATALLAACGGGSTPESGRQPSPANGAQAGSTPTATVTDEQWREHRTRTFEEVSGTAEYQSAHQAADRCLEQRGYQVLDRAYVLLDGSVHDLKAPTGHALTGAWLSWRVDSEQCDDESGITAMLTRAGIPPDTFDPARVVEANSMAVPMMRCMKARGWAIPDAKRLRNGLIIFDTEPIRTADPEAWELGIKPCEAEALGLGPGGTR